MSLVPKYTGSRGLKNNNPGNLVLTNINWQGKIPNSENTDFQFEQFKALKWGIRAYFKDVINDVGKGANTVSKLISQYAPAFENDTKSYINAVASSLGIKPTDVIAIDKATLKALAKAQFAIENGVSYANQITEKDYQDAFDVLGVELKEGTSFCQYCGHALAIIGLFFFTYITLSV